MNKKNCKQDGEVRFEEVVEMLNKIANLFSDEKKIEIHCDAQEEIAYSHEEGKIYLPPAVSVFESVTDNTLLYAVFLLHEVGYLLYSFFDSDTAVKLKKRNEIIMFAREQFGIDPDFDSLCAFCQHFPAMLFPLISICEDFRIDYSILYKEFRGYAEINNRFYRVTMENYFNKDGDEKNTFNSVLLYLRLRQNTFTKKYAPTIIPLLDDFIREVQSNQDKDVSVSLLTAIKIFNVIKQSNRIQKKPFSFSVKWNQCTWQNKRTTLSKKQGNKFIDNEEKNSFSSLINALRYGEKTVKIVRFQYMGESILYPSEPIENFVSPFVNNTSNPILRQYGTKIDRRAAYKFVVARTGNLAHHGKIFSCLYPEKEKDDSQNIHLTFILDSSRSMFLPRKNTYYPFKRAISFIHALCQLDRVQSRIICPRDLGDEVEIEECKTFAEPYYPDFGIHGSFVCAIDPAATLRFLHNELNDNRQHLWLFLTDTSTHIFRQGFRRNHNEIAEHCRGCDRKRCSVEATDLRTTFASEKINKWNPNKTPLLTEHPTVEIRLVREAVNLLPSNVRVLFFPCDEVKTAEQFEFWNALASHWACIGKEYGAGFQLLEKFYQKMSD